MSPSRGAVLLGLAILAVFAVAAVAYWFLSGYLDPAGTVLLLFVGGSAGFGFAMLLRAAALDH
jgi:hypothetical protein